MSTPLTASQIEDYTVTLISLISYRSITTDYAEQHELVDHFGEYLRVMHELHEGGHLYLTAQALTASELMYAMVVTPDKVMEAVHDILYAGKLEISILEKTQEKDEVSS